MAERKKNKKAEEAMAIANAFKEIEALATLMRTKIQAAEELMKSEGNDIPTRTTTLVSIAEFASSKAAHWQAQWHNIAFDRGYFETVEGPRKMSKSDVNK